MGKYLQIRVSAFTYRPKDILKAWPRLCKIAWPDEDERSSDRIGVLQIVENLRDQVTFGSWPEELKQNIQNDIDSLQATKDKLESFLGDWKAGKANEESIIMEEQLDELEKKVADLNLVE